MGFFRSALAFASAASLASVLAVGCADGVPTGDGATTQDPGGPPVTSTGGDASDGTSAGHDTGAGDGGEGTTDATVDQGAPLPLIQMVAPSSAVVGSVGPTVVVTGKNFTAKSVVQADARDLATSFVSATELRATLPTASLAHVGSLLITVETPAPGGGRSATVPFDVVNPLPTATTLAPTSVAVGAGDTSLVVTGTGFVGGSTVLFDQTSLATTLTDPTTLTATIPATKLTTAGSFNVAVQNPAPGGGTSSNIAFIVSNPTAISITAIAPQSAIVGSPQLTLSVTGKGFIATSVVSLNGLALPTTFVNAQQLTAVVPASSLATVGDLSVTVSHTQPGGGTSISAPATFRVVYAAPTLTSISPSAAAAGASPIDVTVTGTGFVVPTQITFDGATAATTFLDATHVRATLTSVQLATAKNIAVRVVTGLPGGGTSLAGTFTVNNPGPTITAALAPSSTTVGAGDTTIAVTGTGFVAGSVVRVNGTDRATQVASATQLTATLPSTLFVTAGTLSVTVVNPAPGGGTSGPATFTVNNVAPTLRGVTPSSVVLGSPATTLTVSGAGFVQGAIVRLGVNQLSTVFVSDTQLSAQAPANLLATAGSFAITVLNPAPGGGASSAFSFTVSNPSVSITSISPSVLTLGAANVGLTVNGAGFVGASVLSFNGTAIPTTFVSTTQLQANLAGPLSTAGDFPITVTNPPPGGGVSGAATLSVQNPVPVLSSISPNSVSQGAGAPNGLTVTANGSGFVDGVSALRANGTALPTTVVTGSLLTGVVPASLLASVGNVTITVTNPAPGGGTSTSQNLAVSNACDTTGVDFALTAVNPTLAASSAVSLAWTGVTARARHTAGACPRSALDTTTSPVRSYVIQNASSGTAVLSSWAVCSSTLSGDSDAFLAFYGRGTTVPTAIPATDAERKACTGSVSEGESAPNGLTSLEPNGSAWCPGLTKANGAGITLQRCERVVVQIQPYSTTSSSYPPPATLKFRLESP